MTDAADAAAARSDWRAALKGYEAAISKKAPPRSQSHARAGAARCLLELDCDLDRVVRLCDEAIAIDPARLDAYVMRATVFERQGKHGLAIKALNAAVKATPPPHDALIARIANDKMQLDSLIAAAQRASPTARAPPPHANTPAAAASRAPNGASVPAIASQRWDIARLAAQYKVRGLEVGDSYALLPASWWAAWCAYVGGFSVTRDVDAACAVLQELGTLAVAADDATVRRLWRPFEPAGGGGDSGGGEVGPEAGALPPPGVIDTWPLVDIAESVAVADAAVGVRGAAVAAPTVGAGVGAATAAKGRAAGTANSPPQPPPPPSPEAQSAIARARPLLRRTARDFVDYVVLGEEAAAKLVQWYGATGPLLRRVVVAADDADDGDVRQSWAGAGGGGAGGFNSPPASPRDNAVQIFPRDQRRLWARREAEAAAAATAAAAAAAAVAAATPAAGGAAPTAGARDAAPSLAPAVAAAAAAASPAPPRPQHCATCGRPGSKRCGRCSALAYCSLECQKVHWMNGHRAECAGAGGGGASGAGAAPAVAAAGGGGNGSSVGDEQLAARRPPHPGPSHNGLVGLNNLGNTCFMASSLQTLSAAWPLTSHMLSDNWKKDVNTQNRDGSGGRIARAYSDLLRRMWFAPRGTAAVDPSDMKRALSAFQGRFAGYAQHDAAELLQFVLDGLHEDLNRVTVKTFVPDPDERGDRPDADAAADAWARYLARERSVVTALFAGQFKSRTVCPGCGTQSLKFDAFTTVQLPLPSPPAPRADFVVRVAARPLLDTARPEAWRAPSAAAVLAAVLRATAAEPPRDASNGAAAAVADADDAAAADAAVAGAGAASVGPGEADYRDDDAGGRPWAAYGVSLPGPRVTVGALLRSVAAEASAPPAALLLLYAPPFAAGARMPRGSRPAPWQWVTDLQTEAIPPSPGGATSHDFFAFVLPPPAAAAPEGDGGVGAPLPSSTKALAASDAAARPPAPAKARGRVVIVLHHLTPRTTPPLPFVDDADGVAAAAAAAESVREDEALVAPLPGEAPFPAGFAASDVARDSVRSGPPSVLVLPRAAGVAQLRYAAARAAAPLRAGGWAALRAATRARLPRAAAAAATDAAVDALALAELAEALPLLTLPPEDGGDGSGGDDDDERRFGAAACEWVPPHPAAAERSDGGAALGVALGVSARAWFGDADEDVVVQVGVAWRSPAWWGLFDPLRAVASAATPSLTAMRRAAELRRAAAAAALAASVGGGSGSSSITLASCFARFTEPVVLDRDNAVTCDKCRARVLATNTQELFTVPRLLVLVLKRFRQRSAWTQDKVDALVDFPLVGLDLTAVAAGGGSASAGDAAAGAAPLPPPPPPGAPLLYDCFGVVNHYGKMAWGHYTAFANLAVARYGADTGTGGGGSGSAGAPDALWYEFDDRRVRRVLPADVVSAAAYILLYRRRD